MALAIPEDDVTRMLNAAQEQLQKGNKEQATKMGQDLIALGAGGKNSRAEACGRFVVGNALLSKEASSWQGICQVREALLLFRDMNDVGGMQASLHTLANGLFSRGDLEEGLKMAWEALVCYRLTGDKTDQVALRQSIDQARQMAQEFRRQGPRRAMPFTPGPLLSESSGPQMCPETESSVKQEWCDIAASGRKFWGVPKHVDPDVVEMAERAPSHSVVWSYALTDNSPSQMCIEFGELVTSMAKGDINKIPILVQTCGVHARMCGDMVPASMTNVSAATVWGMIRTMRQEIPQVQITVLDFPGGMTAAQIPRMIRPAIPMVPESAYYHQLRWEPQITQVPSLFRRDLKKDNMTSGGANVSDPRKQTRFTRKSFNWTGPSVKLDFAWYRQEWKAVGPAEGDIGPMPPQQPVRAVRAF